MFLKNKKVLAVLLLLLLLLLLLWFFWPTGNEPAQLIWHSKGKITKDTMKLHEADVDVSVPSWSDCCEGTIKVVFDYRWDFFLDPNPEDCCTEYVHWMVKDSNGTTVFNEDFNCPVDDTVEITTGYWDCVHPWTVTVTNYCVFPVVYSYEIELFCYE